MTWFNPLTALVVSVADLALWRVFFGELRGVRVVVSNLGAAAIMIGYLALSLYLPAWVAPTRAPTFLLLVGVAGAGLIV